MVGFFEISYAEKEDEGVVAYCDCCEGKALVYKKRQKPSLSSLILYVGGLTMTPEWKVNEKVSPEALMVLSRWPIMYAKSKNYLEPLYAHAIKTCGFKVSMENDEFVLKGKDGEYRVPVSVVEKSIEAMEKAKKEEKDKLLEPLKFLFEERVRLKDKLANAIRPHVKMNFKL